MQVEDLDSDRQLKLCGTVLNRQPLVYCDSCSRPMGTVQYLDYVHNGIRKDHPDLHLRNTCDSCTRSVWAEKAYQIGNW